MKKELSALWTHLRTEHGVTLTESELLEIVKLARNILNAEKQDVWENAPEWANYYTIDADGEATFWEFEPYINGENEHWSLSDVSRGRYRTISSVNKSSWYNSLCTCAQNRRGCQRLG